MRASASGDVLARSGGRLAATGVGGWHRAGGAAAGGAGAGAAGGAGVLYDTGSGADGAAMRAIGGGERLWRGMRGRAGAGETLSARGTARGARRGAARADGDGAATRGAGGAGDDAATASRAVSAGALYTDQRCPHRQPECRGSIAWLCAGHAQPLSGIASGKARPKTLPTPTTLSAQIRPPWRSTISREMKRPRPRPTPEPDCTCTPGTR